MLIFNWTIKISRMMKSKILSIHENKLHCKIFPNQLNQKKILITIRSEGE